MNSPALRGEPDAVALDTWMAKAFGITDISLLAKQDVYDLLADALRELATEATSHGKTVEPRQLQAAVWTGIKAEGPEHLTSEPIDKILKDMWAMFKTEQAPVPASVPAKSELF